METLLQDIRYAIRTFLRNPGFTIVAVLSLALGIGANTAIFSFLNTVLLRTLPVRNPGQLALFGQGNRRGNTNSPSGELFSRPAYHDLQKATPVLFEDILAVDSTTNRAYADFGAGREGVRAILVSGNFFSVLGVYPRAGRFFGVSDEHTPGANPVAVLNDAFWARRFHRDPAIVGRSFRLGKREYTIAGVAPEGFFGTRLGESPDLWVPVTMQADFTNADLIGLNDPKSNFLNLIGRLKPGVTLAQAQAVVSPLYRRLASGYTTGPLPSDLHVVITPADRGLSRLRTKYRGPLFVLMAVVALVLAIACANVANLLVALSAKRRREVAVRIAIGANRFRLIRQLLTEGVLLSAAAGALGLLIASLAARILVALISTGPDTVPIAFDPDLRVLAFTIGVSLLTGVLFSLAPALRASRVDPITSLKEGKASMESRQKVGFGRAIAAGQVAVSLTLLITAGLLLRSFENLVATDTGFDRRNVLLVKIDSESSGYKQDVRLSDLYQRVEDKVSRLPGVTAAGVSLYSFHEGGWGETFFLPGADPATTGKDVGLNFVTPGFFKTFGVPVLAGRVLDSRDTVGSQLVAVVGEHFAASVFGGHAVGKTFMMAPVTEKAQPYLIVGVVRDIKSQDLRDKPANSAFIPLAQNPVYAGNVVVRVTGSAAPATTQVRAALNSVEPDLPLRWTTTLENEVSDSLVSERALAQISAFFAALALLLSAIGLYGTISFNVARRTGEIGIRIALGAERSGVLGMVMRDTMTLVGVGVAVGLPMSLAAGLAMNSLFYGLGSFDFLTACAAVLALSLAAALAGYLPARRAARIDPMIALRCD